MASVICRFSCGSCCCLFFSSSMLNSCSKSSMSSSSSSPSTLGLPSHIQINTVNCWQWLESIVSLKPLEQWGKMKRHIYPWGACTGSCTVDRLVFLPSSRTHNTAYTPETHTHCMQWRALRQPSIQHRHHIFHRPGHSMPLSAWAGYINKFINSHALDKICSYNQFSWKPKTKTTLLL